MNQLHSRSVVVGVDGSKGAANAATWAVDEAVRRNVPLRLLYAIDPGEAAPAEVPAGKLAAAETAVRDVCTAIHATGQPVTIETEIAEEPPIRSLLRASASAAMVCVGAVGMRHFRADRVGSTAAALASSALCPVAIIRGHDGDRGQHAHGVVVDVEGSADNGVLLGAAMEEARLRNASIQAIVCAGTSSGDDQAVRDGDRRALADLDRRLACWRRRYPSVEVEPVAVHGSLVDYLAHNQPSARLVIVDAHNRRHLQELTGPTGSAILEDTECSLLIVNRQHL